MVLRPADVMLPARYSDYNAAVDGITFSSSPEQSRRSKSRLTSKPSWLLLSISGADTSLYILFEFEIIMILLFQKIVFLETVFVKLRFENRTN
ncbi:hypothetical protein R6Q59_012330 [Mikania micrantha]